VLQRICLGGQGTEGGHGRKGVQLWGARKKKEITKTEGENCDESAHVMETAPQNLIEGKGGRGGGRDVKKNLHLNHIDSRRERVGRPDGSRQT